MNEPIQIQSDEIEQVPIRELLPHPKNMHSHSDDQISRLCKLIKYQGFRNPLIVQKGTNLIVAGHGRLEAAKNLGMEYVPVTYQEFTDDAQLYAYMVSDNAIGKDTWATLDLAQINVDIGDLGPELDIDMLGLKDFTVEPLDSLDENYSREIKPPIYEPTGENPPIGELVDYEKTNKLIEEVNDSDLSQDTKHFLLSAATRHSVFNYEKIAEFYAHADKLTQELMEKSGLVIIDFEKAIEYGFVNMSKKLAEEFNGE